jgi:two-component system chemotaxis sensor kinase CheA
MDLDNALQTFIEESRDLLAAMEDALLTLETAAADAEAINAVFRAMHTIKGTAGLFGLDPIVSFTHVAESVMDRVRGGELTVDERLTGLLLRGRDYIGSLVDDLDSAQNAPEEARLVVGKDLMHDLGAYLNQTPATHPTTDAAGTSGQAVPTRPQPGVAVQSDAWHISIRFAEDLLRNGYDPLSFVRYLGRLGELVHVTTVSDAMPTGAAMDPETCYLGFEIRLVTEVEQSVIESTFDFIRTDCSLTILPPHSQISDYMQLIRALPEDDERLSQLLVTVGALTTEELQEGLSMQARVTADADAGPNVQQSDEHLPEQESGDSASDMPGPASQRSARENRRRESRVIRVEAAKLDELINLVGELVTAGATASVMAQRSRDRSLIEANAAVGQLVENVRDSALRMRMVEIGETFNRFRRVVRDVAQELGKDIDLVITGAETELDKSVVEKIGDPLMHLVRNAMDHGIEAADVRRKAGKPATGTLRLNAYHDSGSIVIEISDDGAGLDRDRLLNKAQERGLIQADQQLSDQEVYDLIFEPGFSTAEQVTNLSGRGVGMDVVRRNIDALRGTINLDSQPGAGTTVTIRLPLTLAIIDGFLVGVGEGAYIIPLECVVECMELNAAETEDQNYLNLRGKVLPFLRLRDLFQVKGTPGRRQNIVVIRYAGQSAGLVVDRLMGEFQTVIKPMVRMFRQLQGISGSAILGTGDVAMILDVQELIRVAAQREYGQPRCMAHTASMLTKT